MAVSLTSVLTGGGIVFGQRSIVLINTDVGGGGEGKMNEKWVHKKISKFCPNFLSE